MFNIRPTFATRVLPVTTLALIGLACGGSPNETAATAPSITGQPQGLTLLSGDSARMQVDAKGSPAPAYQWRKGGVSVAGQTGSALVLAAAQPSDEGVYDVTVSNASGSVTSAPATLTVNRLPTFTTQPAMQSVASPASAHFTVAVDGKPAPTLQWQSSANGADWANLSGATGTTYTLASTTAGQSGTQYRCVASNEGGNTPSQSAYLLVNQTSAHILTVNLGPGVSGTPATSGPTTAGSVAYSFSPLSGYSSVAVTLDGATVSTSGTVTMGTDHALAATATPTSGEDTGITVGKTPYEITFVNASGLASKLSDYKGKVIFLACSEVYCNPCQNESLILQNMQNKYGAQGLVIIEILSDFGTHKVSSQDLTKWAADAGFTSVPALHDTNGVPDLYQITGFPTNILIGRDFKIKAVQVGYSPYTVEQMIIKGLK